MHLAPLARPQHGPCAARFLSSGREEQHLLLSPGCAEKSGLSRVRPYPQGCHPTSQGDPTVCPHPVSEPSREEKPPRHGWSWAGLQYPGLVLTPHRGHTWRRHARPVWPHPSLGGHHCGSPGGRKGRSWALWHLSGPGQPDSGTRVARPSHDTSPCSVPAVA